MFSPSGGGLMVALRQRKKALSVSPLKVSQPVGASLAFLGLQGAMPLMHGAQGCTAFAKVFLVRHFREPIPLQTTAMDQVSSVMGADESIVEALVAICGKAKPEVVGVISTGLAETQGCDLRGAVKRFYALHPELRGTRVVAVSAPDFAGCLETGYAAAVLELLKTMAPAPCLGQGLDTVNILPSSMFTPGDLEEIEALVAEFGLKCRTVPNLAESLGGELTNIDFSSVTVGGTPVSEVSALGAAAATLALGPSMHKCGAWLQQQTGVRTHFLDHLHSLSAVDAFVSALLETSGRKQPSSRVLRQRRQLTDAMLDTHFFLGQRRLGLAGDPDLLLALSSLVQSVGCEAVATVAPSRGPALDRMLVPHVTVGDLEDLETEAAAAGVQLLLGNSHAAETAERLHVPLLRAGFPQYDTIGGYARRWVGYRGVRDVLFNLANTVHHLQLDEIPAYQSQLSPSKNSTSVAAQ